MNPSLTHYLEDVRDVAATVDTDAVEGVRFLLDAALYAGARVYTVGNGGSGSLADHLALGLSLNVRRERGRGWPALSLSANAAVLSAAANDFGVQEMFSAQLSTLGRPGDVLVAISASGSSRNVVQAVLTAKTLGMKVAAFVGKTGPIADASHQVVMVGGRSAAIMEDVTQSLLHWIYCSFMEAPRA